MARPVYETLPAIYGVIGLAALYTFYIDPGEVRGKIAFMVSACFAIIAAVTLTLHRQDFAPRGANIPAELLEL